jgi:hypothetical protein
VRSQLMALQSRFLEDALCDKALKDGLGNQHAQL